MQTVLIAIHLIIVVALVAVVLLQRSEGGALGMGGGGGFMTGRGQANVLTRATAILAAIFFVTSLSLTLLANYGRTNKSILEGVAPGTNQSAPAMPPKGEGSVLDQLQQIEKQRANSGTSNPTAATAPSPAATTPKAAAPVEPTGMPSKPAATAPMSPKVETRKPDAAAPTIEAPKAEAPKTETPAGK